MEKRVKLIYILTLIASLAVVVSQIYWLYNQYIFSLQYYEDEMFTKTINVSEADMRLRDELQNKKISTITRSEIRVEQISNSVSESKVGWNFEIYIVKEDEIIKNSQKSVKYDSLYVDSLYKSGKDINKYFFKIEVIDKKNDVYDALERFFINEKCSFTTKRLDSLLRMNQLFPATIRIETTDSMIWESDRMNHTSIFHPTLEITYPFDILQKQQVRIIYHLSVFTILKKMLLSFICSVIFSFLLIFCLIYQIHTIFRLQLIEELRKNFIYTMTHELKRPITALKLCMSFIKNEKMMLDEEMKKEIINNSQNELDNLSSYFSKLRDVMGNNLKNIPLNLSTFNLRELVEQCIQKQFFPSSREIDVKVDFEDDEFEITADKIHIANIICNLLENAIKYSEGKTLIRISCSSINNKYLLEVSDNGFGIPEVEHNYVFNRFFRSENAEKKNIPGIGLGLFYVKLLVNAHNGSISLYSTLGNGSKFIIEIPKRQ